MDPLTDEYLTHIEREHRRARYVSDMTALARNLGISVIEGKHSIAAGKKIQVCQTAPKQVRRAETAHELVHVLANEEDLTEKVRYYHASAPNIDAHIEELTDHGSDRLLMPEHLVREIIEQHGENAQGLWELAIAADVSIEQAMRRWVHLRPGRRAAFLLSKTYIYYALSTWWVPFWIGSRLDDLGFQEAGGTIYQPDTNRAFRLAYWDATE